MKLFVNGGQCARSRVFTFQEDLNFSASCMTPKIESDMWNLRQIVFLDLKSRLFFCYVYNYCKLFFSVSISQWTSKRRTSWALTSLAFCCNWGQQITVFMFNLHDGRRDSRLTWSECCRIFPYIFGKGRFRLKLENIVILGLNDKQGSHESDPLTFIEFYVPTSEENVVLVAFFPQIGDFPVKWTGRNWGALQGLDMETTAFDKNRSSHIINSWSDYQLYIGKLLGKVPSSLWGFALMENP